MKIHREGYTSLFFTLLVLVGLVVIINIIWPHQSIGHYIGYGILGMFFLLILQFFRSPKRLIVENPSQVLSPADGKVVVVETNREQEYLDKECLQISIFMSPINVHVNRYPVAGVVKYCKYHPGKYLVAWHPKSSTLNERTTVVVETPAKQQVLFRQIAGALARRIVCYSKEGEFVKQGHEMGFIKFGSRVDVFLPVDANVKVVPGQAVKGGKTILATFE